MNYINLAKSLLKDAQRIFGRLEDSRTIEFLLTIARCKPGFVTNVFSGEPPKDFPFAEYIYDVNNLNRWVSEIEGICERAGLYFKSFRFSTDKVTLVSMMICKRSDRRRIQLAREYEEIFQAHCETTFLGKSSYDSNMALRNGKLIGKFCGYPECCIKAWAAKKIKPHKLPGHIELFLSHGMCSANCEYSIRMAEKYAVCIENITPDYKIILLLLSRTEKSP